MSAMASNPRPTFMKPDRLRRSTRSNGRATFMASGGRRSLHDHGMRRTTIARRRRGGAQIFDDVANVEIRGKTREVMSRRVVGNVSATIERAHQLDASREYRRLERGHFPNRRRDHFGSNA